MERKAFYSFHYQPDNWRAAQVRNMGVIEGNQPVVDNDWEEIKKGGDKAIEDWINAQLKGKSVAIVLIGQDTANRKWINYEIKKAWSEKKGVLGIYIHNLKDSEKKQSTKGQNPFSYFTINNVSMDSIVKSYDPPYSDSSDIYNYIKNNILQWIETAISIRNKY